MTNVSIRNLVLKSQNPAKFLDQLSFEIKFDVHNPIKEGKHQKHHHLSNVP